MEETIITNRQTGVDGSNNPVYGENISNSQPETTDSVGLHTQLPGQPTTGTGIANETGGIGKGNFIKSATDRDLYRFKDYANAPLTQYLLNIEATPVDSPVVDHYMMGEERAILTLASAVSADPTSETFTLPLISQDKAIPTEFQTLLVPNVAGYDKQGNQTPNKPIMLYVVGKDSNTKQPVVMAVNGPRSTANGPIGTPAIPVDAEIVTMSTMMYETLDNVPPDSFAPQMFKLHLQKRGVTQIISDYYDMMEKEVDFQKVAQFEESMKNFFLKNDRTLIGGIDCELNVSTPNMGIQKAFGSDGLRWQVLRELQHSGAWTYEDMLALHEMFFCCEDAPTKGILFAGRGLIRRLQSIDYSKHPEAQLTVMKDETVGWKVSNIHSFFGDTEIKHMPALDKLGWSNSGLLLAVGENRLKRYQFSKKHRVSTKVDGHEAKRNSTIVWDGTALKGTAHIWIDGQNQSVPDGILSMRFYETNTPQTPPTYSDVENGVVYYFKQETWLAANNGVATKIAEEGSMWRAKITSTTSNNTTTYNLSWEPYTGTMIFGA